MAGRHVIAPSRVVIGAAIDCSDGMAETSIALGGLERLTWSTSRRGEPVTVGVPFPTGALQSPADLRLWQADGSPTVLQARALDRWPDNSIRWALLDLRVDVADGWVAPSTLRIAPGSLSPRSELQVASTAVGVDVSTSRATFRFLKGGAFPVSDVVVGAASRFEVAKSGLSLVTTGRRASVTVDAVVVRAAGPMRVDLDVRGSLGDPYLAGVLEIVTRVELFAGSTTARLTTTIRNRRRARHRGGRWPLGDRGSLFIDSAILRLQTGAVRRVRSALEVGEALADSPAPFEVYQEASGGDNWASPVHRNRDGRVPLRFRGYRCRSGATERSGDRASPIVVIDSAGGQVSVAVPEFWQKFPSAIAVTADALEIGLMPAQAAEPCELQGGEQRTHVVTVAYASDDVSDPPLAWCHDPALLGPTAAWACGTGAEAFLVPMGVAVERDYLALVASALDPEDGFAAKRERADEFGWRHYGDLVADHESALQPSDQPFVSHYNNQYDAVAGFAIQFLRSGDARWWRLMHDLARHVRDVDVYHTTEDKAAYNGGLFWHTLHYADAGTATHRCYPAGRPEGGGPSSEHNYATGLMLHFFLTGDPASRDAAIGLGRWVIDMDDGRLSAFRWLANGPTGLASASGSLEYHGPGRGAANSILTCLVAGRLTGEQIYTDKAEELIRRSIHPDDDIEARQLFDIERRWFYTVFLQAIGTYLAGAAGRGAFGDTFAYAQASLLAYARWMAKYESPYLDHPERLEYPNETWAAQDMRKAEVFWWAALHAEAQEREMFLERAQFFYEYSTATLLSMPTRRFTRPVVLVLSNGYRAAWLASQPALGDAQRALPRSWPARPDLPFVAQKIRALRRLRWVAAGALTAMLALVAWLRAW